MNAILSPAADTPARGVQRVRHELKRRRLTVQSVQRLNPQMINVRLAGPELSDFPSLGFDDHVKLLLPAPAGEPPAMRDYTPRRFDRRAGTLDIEFVLHGAGAASDWASQAAPGQQVEVGGPRGSFVVPADLDWHLLVGDETALPAIARRLEALPASTRATVIVQTLHPDTRVALHSAARLELQWLDGGDASSLAAVLARWARPAGEGYAWAAGETASIAQVRRVLVEQHGLHKEQVRAAAYWKQGAVGHHETL